MRKREYIMLAHPAEEKRIQNPGPLFLCQPKLNGVRCIAEYSDEWHEWILRSSTGMIKPFLNHIKEALNHLPGHTYDGELYIHGKSWAYINSIASRTENPSPAELELEYHIFDIKNQKHQTARSIELNEIISFVVEREGLTPVKMVSTVGGKPDDWKQILAEFTKNGYEGIMFRKLDGMYEEKRSKNLLKFKPTLTDIYRITDLIQGKGWCYDRLGAFEVESKDGSRFQIGSGKTLTKENRLKYWLDRENLIGKYILVKHEYLVTANNLPQCAVALEVLTDSQVEAFRKKKHEDLL